MAIALAFFLSAFKQEALLTTFFSFITSHLHDSFQATSIQSKKGIK